MPRILGQTVVKAPAATAFKYVADFSNIGSWDPGVVRSSWKDGKPAELAVGAKFDLRTTFRGTESDLTYEIVEMEFPTRVVLRGENDQTLAIDTVRFEEVPGKNETIVHWQADIALKGFKSLFNPFLGPLLRPLGPAAMNGLAKKGTELWGAPSTPVPP
jgi:hypothetical protein